MAEASALKYEHNYTYPNDHEQPPLCTTITRWEHCHNVYMGLGGFYLVEDEQEGSLPLPKGRYDISDALRAAIHHEGSLRFNPHGHAGAEGDVIFVNGAAASCKLERRKYASASERLDATTFILLLVPRCRCQIATDGGDGGPSKYRHLDGDGRACRRVVIDFSAYAEGDSVSFATQRNTDRSERSMRFDTPVRLFRIIANSGPLERDRGANA